MKNILLNINSVSPRLRDGMLNLNIGKYNQIEQRLIHPIGEFYKIDYEDSIKTESTMKTGLLDYTNNTSIIKSVSDMGETLYFPNKFNRGTISTDIGYDSVKPQKYSYLEGYTYNDPKDKNWLSIGIQSGIGYIMGDSVGIGLNNGNLDIVSTSLETSTSLTSRLTELTLGDSDISKVGMEMLSAQLINSITQRTRISKGVDDFFSKPVDFYNSIDTLDFDKMSNIDVPKGILGISSNMLPIYFYSEIKNGKTSEVVDNGNVEYSWVNKADHLIKEDNTSKLNKDGRPDSSVVDKDGNSSNRVDISILSKSPQSLLNKTQKLFQSGKIQTIVSDITNTEDGMVKGRGLKNLKNNTFRIWTSTNQYNKISSLIRPFNKENTIILNKTLSSVRPGFDSLDKYGVLQDNGFVKISPYNNDDFGKSNQREVKKYMFSIENLAWKGSIDSIIEGTSQEGPNGGRIMWFPPYDISFNETTSVNWNSDTFIGRGEPVYTYANTERGGTLNFKVIVDHPSILNYYSRDGKDIKGKNIVEEDYLRFFAGTDVLELKSITGFTKPLTSIESLDTPNNPPKTISFKVFFPNNYSGINDIGNDTLDYLMHGVMCSATGGTGYENEPGDNIISVNKNNWKGLTLYGATTGCCFDNLYYYRADDKDDLPSPDQYKDTASYGLNAKKATPSDPNSFSFREIYNAIYEPFEVDSYEYLKRKSKQDYVNSAIFYTNSNINKIITENDLTISKIVGTGVTEAWSNFAASQIIYDDANNKLRESYDNFIRLNPGWFTSVSTMKGDNNGNFKMSFSSDDIVQSCWNDYSKQEEITIDKLTHYLSLREAFILTGSGFTEYNASMLEYNTNKSILDVKKNDLINSVDNLLLEPTDKTPNEVYETLKNAKKITILGSASKQGKDSVNEKLAINRAKVIEKWLREHNNEAEYVINSAYNESKPISVLDTSSKEAKSDRFTYVIITTDPTGVAIQEEMNKIGVKNDDYVKKDVIVENDITILPKRVKKSMYGYYYDPSNPDDPKLKLKNDESMFFKKIEDAGISDIIQGKLSEKIKYFHPAFHSTTPEGFNSRLTFLHQCTRQGPTLSATDDQNNKRSATNMSFGRPPICILRVGDFYNTKVIFESLNIDFDPLVWDLNQEGIGVQPMIATVSMNFKFIGGSDLTGPIARLQNAITFNFFANTGVYDDRNDRINSHSIITGDTYDNLYNPKVYDKQIIKKETIETRYEKRSDAKEVNSWVGKSYNYVLITNEDGQKWVRATSMNGLITKNGNKSYNATPDELVRILRIELNDF